MGTLRRIIDLNATNNTVEAQRPGSLQSRLARLTDREVEVLDLLLDGHSLRNVAENLRISPKTAEIHVSHSFASLGLRNVAHFFKLAIEQNWLELPPRDSWQTILCTYESLSPDEKNIIAQRVDNLSARPIGNPLTDKVSAILTQEESKNTPDSTSARGSLRNLFILSEVVKIAREQGIQATPRHVQTPSERRSTLSAKEAKVIQYLIDGLTNQEITARMESNSKTISTYTARAFEKLYVKNIAELYELAINEGWLALPPHEQWPSILQKYNTLSDGDVAIIAEKITMTPRKAAAVAMHRSDRRYPEIKKHLGVESLRDLIVITEVVRRAEDSGMQSLSAMSLLDLAQQSPPETPANTIQFAERETTLPEAAAGTGFVSRLSTRENTRYR